MRSLDFIGFNKMFLAGTVDRCRDNALSTLGFLGPMANLSFDFSRSR